METILKWVLAGEAAAIVGLTTALLLTLRKGKKAPGKPVNVPAPVPSAQMILLQGLAQYAGRFTGLYEALHMSVGSGQVPDAYHEWHVRMVKLQVDTPFYQAFIARFPQNGTPYHVQDLMAQIRNAGIVRETAATHVADSQTQKRYIYLGADSLCPGQTYNVVKPCWVCNGSIVEQGVLMPGR